MSAITLHSSASTEQAPPLSGTSTTSLAPLPTITSTSTSSFSSSSTTQTQSQKKKQPWGPILNLLLVLVVIILLIFSIVQIWSSIHILFSAQDSSSSSNTSPTTATNSSNSSSNNSSRTKAAAPQLGGLMNSDNNEDNVGEAKDSHAVITSRPLVVRAVDISPPPPPSTSSTHDSSTVTQPKTKRPPPPPQPQPQPHISPGPHPEQQQPHTPSPEGTGSKRVSEKKVDGIVAHTASTHDYPSHHPHDETSSPDSDQNNKASPTAPQNTVILTICAALGGLAGCFCCILGSSRLAICCYYRRRGIVSSNGGVVCVDGKRIGPPRRPILRSMFGSSSSSSSASLVSPLSPSFGQQPQQQQAQMTEFWNVDDPKDSKKSPTSSTSSLPSSKGLFKTLRQQSYTNTINTSLPAKKKKDAPSRLPLAVTAPTAHVISSPVDFISTQHSLDSPSTSSTTSPSGGGGLDSYYPPYTGGWNHPDFDSPLSPNVSSTRGSGSGTGTKSKRMPAHSPLPLSLSLPTSLKRNSCQYASSPLSSGLISPCTTMTPSTAGSSSCSEISPFPWSTSAPYHQNTDDDKSYYSNTGRTMAMSRAQKLHPFDSDTASTLTTSATTTTAMMHTSPRTSPRSPLLSPTGHSLSTTPTVPTPPSMLFPRRDGSGANENSGARSGSNFRGPRSPDHPYDNYYHHTQQQPQQQQQHSYHQHLPQNKQ